MCYMVDAILLFLLIVVQIADSITNAKMCVYVCVWRKAAKTNKNKYKIIQRSKNNNVADEGRCLGDVVSHEFHVACMLHSIRSIFIRSICMCISMY